MVLPIKGIETLPLEPEELPVHELPLDPVTAHDETFERFQYTVVVPFTGTRSGRAWRCPVVPGPALNAGDDVRHEADPGEQNDGDTHVVTLETAHEEFVY